MDLGLRGRTALVCASTGGLGRGVAEALAAEGARVVISGRRHELAAEIADALPGAEWVPLDVTATGAGTAVAAAAAEKLEAPLDIVILNGPGPKPSAASEMTTDQARAAVETLFLFQQELVAAALPGMAERGWGRIVAIGSSSVIEPIRGLAASSVGRAALAAYLKTLAGEVAASGVTVNMVLAGRIDTDRIKYLDTVAAQRDPEAPARSLAAIPAARYGKVDEFAAVATFLCGESAGYVTGSTIRVDGGAAHVL